ncbi:glycosyltransferase family 2 protein [Fibrobacterota bacterium]
MDKQISIYAIIATWNGLSWIKKCLESLANSSVPLNTVLVDNHSTDGTVDYVKKQFPQIHTVSNRQNLGFGKANNQGINIALAKGADFIFLLNQDAWINENTVSHLTQMSVKHPGYGILSPVHLNGEGTELEYTFAFFANSRSCRYFFSDLYLKKPLKEIYEINFVSAAAWLIPRRCIERVGGFDPVFPHYCEDNDFISRLRYHGYKAGICPNTVIFHGQHLSSYDKPVDLELNPKRKYVRVLLKLKDLNKPYLWTAIREIKDLILGIITSAVKLSPARLWSDCEVLCKVLLSLPGVKKSRELSKKGGLIFLD